MRTRYGELFFYYKIASSTEAEIKQLVGNKDSLKTIRWLVIRSVAAQIWSYNITKTHIDIMT